MRDHDDRCSRLSFCQIIHHVQAASLSSEAVGSSAKITDGSLIKARAIATVDVPTRARGEEGRSTSSPAVRQSGFISIHAIFLLAATGIFPDVQVWQQVLALKDKTKAHKPELFLFFLQVCQIDHR